MAGMLLSGSKVFDSIGIGAMLVVFVAMIGSLTVLPALLGRLGDRVERGRGLRALPRPTSRLLGRACSRPVLRATRTRVGRAALRSARRWSLLALPAGCKLHTKLLGFATCPRSIPIVPHLREDPEGVPGRAAPAVVAFKSADVRLAGGARGAGGDAARWRSRAAQAREPIAVT